MPDALTFHDARQLVADVLGSGWRVLRDGYADDEKWLVRYEPTDTSDPGWDLPSLLVDKRVGWVTTVPWQLGIELPEKMRPVTDPEA